MNSINVCEYSWSRSFHDDLMLQDQASGERSQDLWFSGLFIVTIRRNMHILNYQAKQFMKPHVLQTIKSMQQIVLLNNLSPVR